MYPSPFPRERVMRWLAAIVASILLIAVTWKWGAQVLELFRNQTTLQAWITSFGAWAPLVSIGMNAAQVVAAPIPGQVIGLANGYLFGAWLGTLYSFAGVMLGTGIVLVFTRQWGRPFVARLVHGEQLEKLDHLVARRGTLFFFLIFLLPFLPDDLTCFAIGLTALPLGQMFTLIAIGRLPGLFVASWVGANAKNLGIAGWIVLIAGASALALTYMRWGGAVEAGLMGWIERMTRRM